MKGWLQELAISSSEYISNTELQRLLDRAINELGFEYWAIGTWFPVPVSRPAIEALNNYPAMWQRRYREKAYLTLDPSVAHCLSSPLPLVWDEALFQKNRCFWEEAASFGLREGWAIGVHEGTGVQSMLTFARGGEALSATELVAKGGEMQAAAEHVHRIVARRMRCSLAQTVGGALTSREIEVLRWAADGKSARDIGTILSISQPTVRFHIKNLLAKMGVPNITAAAARAVILGIFDRR